jgi:hypothetical protein
VRFAGGAPKRAPRIGWCNDDTAETTERPRVQFIWQSDSARLAEFWAFYFFASGVVELYVRTQQLITNRIPVLA